MTRIDTPGIFALCLLALACAEPARDSSPRPGGRDSSLEGVLESSVALRIDEVLDEWDEPSSPGCTLGIVKNGRLVYKRGVGMANLEDEIPISGESVFDIASMDKQFIGMSILLLAQQGRLTLDDHIQRYLPELPRYQSPVTIRHLVHHTGGIRGYLQLAALAGMAGGYLTDAPMFDLIARQRELNNAPGEEFLYSNSGYFLLGLIVERASGKSLPEFARENIFGPLGMNNTHYYVPRESVVENRATGYEPNGNGGFSVSAQSDRHGLDSSIDDLFRWDQNFVNNKLGGGPDLLAEQASPGVLSNGEPFDYAFGLWVGERGGLRWIGHGGYGGGFNSTMIRYPEQDITVICLCNAEPGLDTPHSGTIYRRVIQVLLADQFTRDPNLAETADPPQAAVRIPAERLASFAGLYVDPHQNRYIYFFLEDDSLKVARDTGYVLSHIGQSRFDVVGQPDLQVSFVGPTAGGRMQVQVTESGVITSYDATESEIPTEGQLGAFSGSYVSEQLAGATYILSVSDGRLVAEALGRQNIPVIPAVGDLFFIVGLINWYPGEPNHQLTMVRFFRDDHGAVSGFSLTREPEGPRNLRFDRLARSSRGTHGVGMASTVTQLTQR